ncbi:hypothetical protein QBD01_001085 [Ochrobactrum sp. 19YEA23]|uniref:hypothetical protein n=1 Tax=Ochrobactrum sp. 19YEA23 TaxID=3039854 RepID=UPI002478C7B0|nr:hypothetical protein [Ochrobactrum sp. 19YEA23]
MPNPYPLPRETRETQVLVGDGVSTTFGPFTWKIFDIEDVAVLTKAAGQSNWATTDVVVIKTDPVAAFSTFTVTFPAPLATTTEYVVLGDRLHKRSTDLFRGGTIISNELEKEISKQGVVLQELRRDANRTITFPPDFQGERTLPSYGPGRAIIWDADAERLTNGPNAEDIAAAEQNAERAEEAAQRAEDAAATINLPSIDPGDAGQILTVKDDGSGYEFRRAPISVASRLLLKDVPVFFGAINLLEPGREGLFVLKAGIAADDDPMEGVLVKSNTPGYYWRRVFDGPVDVRWFGARLDGSFDDTLNVQAALDFHGHAVVPFTTEGIILDGLTLKTGFILEGGQGIYKGAVSDATAKEKVTVRFSGASAINIRSWTFGARATLRGFQFVGTASSTGSAVLLKTSLQPIMGVHLEDLDFNNCYNAIHDEVHSTNWSQMVSAVRIACYFPRNMQIRNRRSQGFMKFEDIRIDYVSNTGAINWDGARFEEIGGLELIRFDVLGLGNDTTFRSGAYGLVVTGNTLRSSVWLDRVLMDSLNSNGLLINGIFNVQGQCVSAGLCYGNSITLQACDFISLDNVTVYGAKPIAGAPSGVQGLRVASCENGAISNLMIKDVKGHGYVLNSSHFIRASGGVIRDNVGTGILEAGTSDFNVNSNLAVLSNTASLTQVGAQSATVSWTPNSGTFTAQTVGAASIA